LSDVNLDRADGLDEWMDGMVVFFSKIQVEFDL
jgi:hypothetical protein